MPHGFQRVSICALAVCTRSRDLKKGWVNLLWRKNAISIGLYFWAFSYHYENESDGFGR